MIRNTLIALALCSSIAAPVLAQFTDGTLPVTPSMGQQNQQLRQDKRDIRQDRRDISRDRADLRQDNQNIQSDKQDIARDRTDLRQDNRQLNQDRSALNQAETQRRQDLGLGDRGWLASGPAGKSWRQESHHDPGSKDTTTGHYRHLRHQ